MKPAARVGAFASLGELAGLVQAFEETALPRAQWDHRAHLGVALWYLFHCDEPTAARRMIQGIKRFNHARGIRTTPEGGYHETLTLFWLCVVRAFIRVHGTPGGDIVSLANGLVDRFGDRRGLAGEFYSAEVLWSPEARARWLPPDVKPLDALAL